MPLFSRTTVRAAGLSLLLAGSAPCALAAPISVVNHSFEDTTGLTEFNEFFFGANPGWSAYDPSLITGNGEGSTGLFYGTLNPATGSPWFGGDTAPDGDNVAIMFGFGTAATAGAGEYGIEQTLGATLTAGMNYTLEVEVGNIAAGRAESAAGVVGAGAFFPLDGFPGYRVELLANGVVIATEDSLVIDEGEFLTSTISFSADAGHAELGGALGIRLVNLNEIPAGSPVPPGVPYDLEVDFDNVRLSAAPVPAPATFALLALGLVAVAVRRR